MFASTKTTAFAPLYCFDCTDFDTILADKAFYANLIIEDITSAARGSSLGQTESISLQSTMTSTNGGT